jgi:hypothetical protein
MNSHPHTPDQCRACHWWIDGLKRPPDPDPSSLAQMDEFLAPKRPKRQIDDTRATLARGWMDKSHRFLLPPVTSGSPAFWEQYGEQMERLLPHQSEIQTEFFFRLLIEFFPSGPRYVQPPK